MGLTITSEHLTLALMAGACSVRGIKEGAPIASLSRDQLAWFEEKFPEITAPVARELAVAAGCDVLGSVSITLCAGDGDGDGDGYGSGDGYGDGYGDGSGYGSGYGYGYGYGYGSGDGDGSGGTR